MSATLPQEWRVSENGLVPLIDVARTAECSYPSMHQAARKGLVRIADQGGHGNTRRVTIEEALFLVTVAAIAVAAGVAFGAMLRALRKSGATITSAGLTIPVRAA